MMSPLPITPSSLTHSIPAIEQGAAVVTPASGSFAAAIAANRNARQFLVRPGEYRGWAKETLHSLQGTPEAPYVIRYEGEGAGEHPVRRADHATVNPIQFDSCEHVVVQGLTCREPDTNWTAEGASRSIVFDRLLTTGQRHPYAIRIFCSDVVVQNTVVLDAVKRHGDYVAIQVKPVDRPLENIHVLNCEARGVKDFLGVTPSGSDFELPVSDLVVENCDAYNLPDYFGATENAIDIKVRPAPGRRNYLLRNRMWGHWPTSVEWGKSAAGDCIVLHQLAQSIDVIGNIFGESISGLRESIFPLPYEKTYRTRDLRILRNYFHDIEGGGPYDGGALDLIHSADVSENAFARCRYVLGAVPSGGYRDGGPRFHKNTRIDCPNLRVAGGTVGDDTPIPFGAGNAEDNGHHSFAYCRRQWTGPELVTVEVKSRLQPRRYSPPRVPFVKSSLATPPGHPPRWRRR